MGTGPPTHLCMFLGSSVPEELLGRPKDQMKDMLLEILQH